MSTKRFVVGNQLPGYVTSAAGGQNPTAADLTPRQVMKLAKCLLDGCAARHGELKINLGIVMFVARPQYASRVNTAVLKQGGEAAFWAKAHALAASCGVTPATQAELRRWGYADWRIPPFVLPPPVRESPGGDHSAA
jgi:hypothetical protein